MELKPVGMTEAPAQSIPVRSSNMFDFGLQLPAQDELTRQKIPFFPQGITTETEVDDTQPIEAADDEDALGTPVDDLDQETCLTLQRTRLLSKRSFRKRLVCWALESSPDSVNKMTQRKLWEKDVEWCELELILR
jgi:hypothetical protein